MGKNRPKIIRRKGRYRKFDLRVVNSGAMPGMEESYAYHHRARSMVLARLAGITDLGVGGDPRQKIIERLLDILGQFDTEHRVIVQNLTERKLYLLHTPTTYRFLSIEFQGRRIRRSLYYGSKARALQDLSFDPKQLTKIRWVEDNWKLTKEVSKAFPPRT